MLNVNTCTLGRIFFAAAALFSAASLHAATHVVDSSYNDGPGTMRDAVRRSAPGDRIVCVITGSISLSGGEIGIGHDLTIEGPNNGRLELTAIGARVFAVRGGNVTISNLALSGGVAGGNAEGGALYNSGNLTLVEMTLWASYAAGGNGTGRGGAISNAGNLTVLRSVLFGNSAAGGSGEGAGGAIYNTGTLSLINSTISACSATGGSGSPGLGGAIYNVGTLSMTNSTIASNTANGGHGGTGWGGGIFQPNGAGITTSRNVIVALNGSPNGPDVAGYIHSHGHNLIGSSHASGGWVGSDLLHVDPQLSDLQDNGGPTPSRIPAPSSPAVDAGDDSVLFPPLSNGDQRGFPRKLGSRIDIGALERGVVQGGSSIRVTTLDEHDDGLCSSDDCTLIEAINAANANPDASVIDFAPNLTGVITTLLRPGGLYVASPVTINGPGASGIGLTAVGEGRIFEIAPGANVTVAGLTIRNGRLWRDDGGAIRNRGNLSLIECALSGNNVASAPRGGGAIVNEAGATLALDRCFLSNNFNDRVGGGIYNEGTLVATNTTFTHNLANNGGAIFSRPAVGGGMTLRNCTITASTAFSVGMGPGDGGGGVYAEGAPEVNHLSNTIVAGNISYTTPPTNPDVRGTFTSDGSNFIGNMGYSLGFIDGLNGDQVGALFAPKNPMLGPPSNNGGSTDTVPLLPGSPAINAGNDSMAPPVDQRGLSRNGRSDIGAFEFNGGAAPVSNFAVVWAGSRKSHGGALVDLPLALSGQPTVEPRDGGSNGDYQMVVVFSNPVSSVNNAQVTQGGGQVQSIALSADGREAWVYLTGVGDRQTIVATVNVTDAGGQHAAGVAMTVAAGDVNGDGRVNVGDTNLTKGGAGNVTTGENYRLDVNLDGRINTGDVNFVKAHAG